MSEDISWVNDFHKLSLQEEINKDFSPEEPKEEKKFELPPISQIVIDRVHALHSNPKFGSSYAQKIKIVLFNLFVHVNKFKYNFKEGLFYLENGLYNFRYFQVYGDMEMFSMVHDNKEFIDVYLVIKVGENANSKRFRAEKDKLPELESQWPVIVVRSFMEQLNSSYASMMEDIIQGKWSIQTKTKLPR